MKLGHSVPVGLKGFQQLLWQFWQTPVIAMVLETLVLQNDAKTTSFHDFDPNMLPGQQPFSYLYSRVHFGTFFDGIEIQHQASCIAWFSRLVEIFFVFTATHPTNV